MHSSEACALQRNDMTNGVYTTTTPDLISKERLKYQNYLDNLNNKFTTPYKIIFTTLITTPISIEI